MFPFHDNLYHYTKLNTVLEFILPQMTIKMGPLHKVNDLRESKSWNFTLYTRDIETNKNFDTKIFEKISNFITHKSLILCMTKDAPELQGTDFNNPDIQFKRGYGHPRMWSQYSENHTGVCLVFDQKLLHNNVELITGSTGLFSDSVEYININGNSEKPNTNPYNIAYLEDILNSGLANILEPHIERYHKEIFFNKHSDWREEWEYRWVFRSNTDYPIFIPIGQAIKGIILGNACPPVESSTIKRRCVELNIPVYRIHQHGWTMSIEQEDIQVEGIGISYNGISYRLDMPCAGVFAQGRDLNGKNIPIRIDNNGDITLL